MLQNYFFYLSRHAIFNILMADHNTIQNRSALTRLLWIATHQQTRKDKRITTSNKLIFANGRESRARTRHIKAVPPYTQSLRERKYLFMNLHRNKRRIIKNKALFKSDILIHKLWYKYHNILRCQWVLIYQGVYAPIPTY